VAAPRDASGCGIVQSERAAVGLMNRGGRVQYFRIFSGPDGESHFEDLAIDLPVQRGSSSLSEMIPADGVIFRRSPADQFVDWHPAPCRQFVITLSGEAEIEASDGEVRRIGPGTVMLAEDVSGRGHITRGRGTTERLSIFIPLPD
jgi:hypothetical protein